MSCPARIFAGQAIASGMWIPYSYRFALARGNGIPLSLVTITSVLSSSPSCCKLIQHSLQVRIEPLDFEHVVRDVRSHRVAVRQERRQVDLARDRCRCLRRCPVRSLDAVRWQPNQKQNGWSPLRSSRSRRSSPRSRCWKFLWVTYSFAARRISRPDCGASPSAFPGPQPLPVMPTW